MLESGNFHTWATFLDNFSAKFGINFYRENPGFFASPPGKNEVK